MNHSTNKIPHALIIDDDELVSHSLSAALRGDWILHEATSNGDLPEMLCSREWDVVFCDAGLGGTNGINILYRLREESPETKVVLMIQHPSAEDVLDATAFGAYDYLAKPIDIDELHLLSKRLRAKLSMPARYPVIKRQNFYTDSEGDLVGRSKSFLNVMKQAGRVAATNLPVLLTGESGTGKEVVAAALHRRSCRAKNPFVAINCGAVPLELIESELFGHVKGSFTGADRDRPGLWEEASGGTIFLDEITETTPAFQVKLLRALQRGEIRRVGSNKTQRLDVRVIAASNRDIERELEVGRFRQDLFYRLNAVSITLPPLRERREDILLLAEFFARRVRTVKAKPRFSPEVIDILNRYPWPGNIRELEHTVIRSVAMCDGFIDVQDLPERVRNYREEQLAEKPLQRRCLESNPIRDWPALAVVEAEYVSQVLAHTHWNKQAAARMLGVDRKTLCRMINRHKIALENIELSASSKSIGHDLRAA